MAILNFFFVLMQWAIIIIIINFLLDCNNRINNCHYHTHESGSKQTRILERTQYSIVFGFLQV